MFRSPVRSPVNASQTMPEMGTMMANTAAIAMGCMSPSSELRLDETAEPERPEAEHDGGGRNHEVAGNR